MKTSTEYKGVTFTVNKPNHRYDKEYNEYIGDIKKVIDVLDRSIFLSDKSYYLYIAIMARSVVNCKDMNNPVYDYVGG